MIHYDRTPYRATGRHGSRVQRANSRRRAEWQRAKSLARSWPQFGAPVWMHLVQHLPPWMLDASKQSPGMSDWYDPDGKPIGMIQASLLLHDIDARRIGLDYIGDYEVSTVHMPDVFHYDDDGQPLMFETMVFRGDREAEQRYLTTTKELAKQQHAEICHRVRQESQGICPHSGETFRDCKASDLCDCFDYPEHEHYRHEG